MRYFDWSVLPNPNNLEYEINSSNNLELGGKMKNSIGIEGIDWWMVESHFSRDTELSNYFRSRISICRFIFALFLQLDIELNLRSAWDGEQGSEHFNWVLKLFSGVADNFRCPKKARIVIENVSGQTWERKVSRRSVVSRHAYSPAASSLMRRQSAHRRDSRLNCAQSSGVASFRK